MLDKILSYFGYINSKYVRNVETNPLTPDEVLSLYVLSTDSLDNSYSPEEEKVLMTKLKELDGFLEWIDFVIDRDIRNHFASTTDTQRSYVRGMQQRLLDIKKRCVETTKPILTRITGVRYG